MPLIPSGKPAWLCVHGIHLRAALAVVDDEDVEVEAREVDRGGQAGGSAADDQAIEWFIHRGPMDCCSYSSGLARAHDVSRIRPDPLPGDVSGAAGRQPGRAGARRRALVARDGPDPRLRDRQASQRRRHAGGRRGGDGAQAGRARRRGGQRRRRPPDAGADAAREAADAGSACASWRRARASFSSAAASRDSTSGSSRPAAIEPVSIGDYVLSGGELGAMVVLDACVRLLPGVMGAASSGEEESFEAGLLEYPHYTRPVDMGRAHDPRSAAVGGSCEDRRVATRNGRSKIHG